jgi:hypothetical protein
MSTTLPLAEEWAFLAGLIEADGCISLIIGSNGYPHARIQFANQSLALHAFVHDRFGAHQIVTSNRSNCFTTHWSDTPTISKVLKGILPYLISKKEEAELLLEYCNNNQGQGKKNLTSSDRILEIVGRIKALRHERP